VNVKAQALLNGVKCVREKFGEQALDEVFAACSPSVRERSAAAIAINWHPQHELCEFLTVADELLGRGDGKLSEEIGAAGARVNLRHIALRLAFFLARPEFLMRRVAGVWRQYNDEGEMVVREFDAGHMSAELVGLSDPNWVLCCSITGWLHEAGLATGMKRLVTTHVECRDRSKGMRCIWQLRWSERDST
jgi:hypothetical protein